MKHPILVILLALAPLSWGEELLSETPYHCKIEFQAGVQTKTLTPTKFKASPNEDFRLMPRSKVDDSITGPLIYALKRTKASGDFPVITEKYSYFVRQLKGDPKRFWNWTGCEAVGITKLGQITCSDGNNTTFAFDADTGRFVRSNLGTWHQETSDSDYTGDDAYFSFGTCEPYYD